jgi:hypothetical protein
MEGIIMGKMLLLLSLVCLAILSIGTGLFPQNPDFWLASGASTYQHIRELLAVVLTLQLITRPPRHIWLRMLSGAVAVTVGVWSIEATYANHMLLFDTLCFLSASVAIGVTALERKAATLGVLSSNKKAFA